MTVSVVGHLSFFFFRFSLFFLFLMIFLLRDGFGGFTIFFPPVIDLTVIHWDAWKKQSKLCFDTKFDA